MEHNVIHSRVGPSLHLSLDTGVDKVHCIHMHSILALEGIAVVQYARTAIISCLEGAVDKVIV